MTDDPAQEKAEDSQPSNGESAAIDQKIRDAIASAVDDSLAGYRKKTNREFSDLRRKLSSVGETPAKTQDEDGGRDAPAEALSRDDVAALVEIGRLQASVDPSIVDALSGLNLSPVQERSILSEIAKTKGQPSKGRDARSTLRATTSATRESAPKPRSLKEYAAIRKNDPERAKALEADPTFDPSSLPYRV